MHLDEWDVSTQAFAKEFLRSISVHSHTASAKAEKEVEQETGNKGHMVTQTRMVRFPWDSAE